MQYQFPQPPDEIFTREYKGVLNGEESPVWLIREIKVTEDKGFQIFYDGIPYARKGWVDPESLHHMNIIKCILRETIKSPLFLLACFFMNKTTLATRFNIVFDRVYNQYRIRWNYLCPAAYHFGIFLKSFLIRIGVEATVADQTALNLAQVLEIDDAYRYRFQDLCGELDTTNSPSKEIKRLYQLFLDRSDSDGVPSRFRVLTKALSILLFFVKVDLSPLKQCALDEDDFYFTYFISHAYASRGLWQNERIITERPQLVGIGKA